MMKKYKEKIMLKKILKNLNFFDIIILLIFKNYTIKIYKIGLNDAFNFCHHKNEKLH